MSDTRDPGTVGQRAWLAELEHRDPEFAGSYAAMRERIMKDGAIPAKYKLLMAVIAEPRLKPG